MNKNKVLSLIGLATKAGKTASGEFATEKAVKSRKAHFVFIAQDASDNTKKKFQNMCGYYKVPCYCLESREMLGRAVGKEFRASLAVLDENFTRAIVEELEKQL